MLVLFDWNYEEKDDKLENCMLEVIKLSLLEEQFLEEIEVSVTLVSDEEIHKLNKKFRNMDKSTDVLSFPMIDFQYDEPEMDKNENGEVILGDIVISLDTARRQAQEYNHSFFREIGFLTAHSMLHLMGYDHMTDEEEKEMFEKQERILQNANLKRE